MKTGQLLLVLFAASMMAGALQLGIILALVVGVFRYPRETFGLLFFGAFLSCFDRYPWPTGIMFAALLLVRLIRRTGREE